MLSQQIISESCSWFHTQQNSGKVFTMQTFSGIGINRLGSYDQCTKDPTFRYFLMKYSLLDIPGNFYTGICYSNNCTSNDLLYIAKSVNQYIPLPFTKLDIYQPDTIPQQWNTYTIITTVLFLTLAVISIVLGVVQYCNRQRNCQKNKHKSNKIKVVQFLSIISSFNFFFRKSNNNERLKVMVGLRAVAFLGITLHNLIYLVISSPSLPNPVLAKLHNTNFFLFNDLWFIISGFYFSFQLSKFWSRCQDYKYIINTFIRKVVKIILFIILAIIISQGIFKSMSKGPLWAITLQKNQQDCNLFNIFNKCNNWLWIWQIQIQMSLFCSIAFVIWNAKIKFNKIIYILLHVIFMSFSTMIVILYGHPDNYSYQGSIIKIPMVSGISYLIGFNIGLSYYYFRIYRLKYRYRLIRILKYKTNRIITSVISIFLLIFIYCHQIFFLLHQADKVGQFIYQILRIIFGLCFFLLILPELLGFQNIWGTLLRDRFMNIISKLSFSAYAIYLTTSIIIVNSLKQDLYINTAKVITLWMCSVMVSLFFGFLIAVLIEMPIYRFLNHWFGKNKIKSYIEFY